MRCVLAWSSMAVAHHEGGVGVAVHPVHEAGHVEVDDVAVLDDGAVGNAVADDFVQTGAHALGIAVIVQRAGVGASFDGEVVDEDVDVVRGHARLHELTGQTQDVGGHLARVPHALDDLGRLHRGFVPARHFAGGRVTGFDDVVGDGAHRRDDPGFDAALESLVATLVTATRTTPAVVVRLRQHLGGPTTSGTGLAGHADNLPSRGRCGSRDPFNVKWTWFILVGTPDRERT